MRKYNFQNCNYRYSYQPETADKMGKLLLRVRADKFKTFRESKTGRQLERFVDIFAQGNGWYEITSKDSNHLDHIFGTVTNGLAVWLRTWNLHHIGSHNANPKPFAVERVKRIYFESASPVKLHDLVGRWRAPVRRHAVSA